MKLYGKKEDCTGCGACAAVCPAGAIRMMPDREGFLYPQTDDKRCSHCLRCLAVCPTDKKTHRPPFEPVCLTARAKDEAVRFASSSGGIFPLLAAFILGKQGVVYGAAYNQNMRVIHREACSQKELDDLKKTKYVQSSLKGIYRKVQKQLLENRWVLFSGTPCQIHALLLFLGKDYPKLITADLVCYGVPSPVIWHSYVAYLEQKYGGRISSFLFRDKQAKDNGHTRTFTAGGKNYSESLYGDIYCKMYFLNYSIRPSCHVCRYCSVDRISDFTLGDFWGSKEHIPGADDKMGTSTVILHTEKAKEVWAHVEQEALSSRRPKKDILQPRLQAPTKRARLRSLFFLLYGILPFSAFILFCKILFLLQACLYRPMRLFSLIKPSRERRNTRRHP